MAAKVQPEEELDGARAAWSYRAAERKTRLSLEQPASGGALGGGQRQGGLEPRCQAGILTPQASLRAPVKEETGSDHVSKARVLQECPSAPPPLCSRVLQKVRGKWK